MQFRLPLIAGLMACAVTLPAATLLETVDFPNAPPALALPTGTTLVNGTLSGLDPNDYFEFSGLLPGGGFNLSASYSGSGIISFVVYNAISGLLGSGSSVSALVPADGIVSVFAGAGTTPGGSYAVSISAPLGSPHTDSVSTGDVPEPSTMLMLLSGLGLTAVSASLRKQCN